jgi:hypothetical protein
MRYMPACTPYGNKSMLSHVPKDDVAINQTPRSTKGHSHTSESLSPQD